MNGRGLSIYGGAAGMLCVLVSTVWSAQFPSGDPACTSVGGLICEDTTWSAAESPFCVTTPIFVGCDATLSVLPGVIVRFSPSSAGLYVGGSFGPGTLVARGIPTDPIVFTSSAGTPNPGDWVGIVFDDTAVDAQFDKHEEYSSGSVLEQVEVAFAGAKPNYAGVSALESAPYFHGCRIHHNAQRGVYAYSDQAIRIESCIISDNNLAKATENGGGLWLKGTGHRVLLNTFAGNRATYGGGLFLDHCSTLVVQENVIHRNRALRGGGLVVSDVQYGDLRANKIFDNTAEYHGGGIIMEGLYETMIDKNVVAWNRAGGDESIAGNGGGIYASGIFTMRANALLFNFARGQGGAIWLYGGGDTLNAAAILESVIVGNVSARFEPSDVGCPFGAGGIYYHGTGLVLSALEQRANVLIANSGYDIVNDNSIVWGAEYSVDASKIWWGTRNAAAIQARICDFFDDPVRSVVFPNPWMSSGGLDTNGDGEVRRDDTHDFVRCIDGPDIGVGTDCTNSDIDGDSDGDLFDFAIFQAVIGE